VKWHANVAKHVQNVHLDLDLRSMTCGSNAMCLSHASLVYHMCLMCKTWLILDATLGLVFVIGLKLTQL